MADSGSSHMAKGRLVERLVAMLHDGQGLELRSNVRYPTRDGEGFRDIDILGTGSVLGRSMPLAAFECKNYGTPVGVAEVSEFRDKLEDVGIPVQHGILVAAGGFQEGATRRARQLGIRLQHLEGLTSDRLAIELHEAVQSVVYLLLTVRTIGVAPRDRHVDDNDQPYFRDDRRPFRGNSLDLLWAHWVGEKLPSSLGEHTTQLPLPRGYRWYRSSGEMPATTTATFAITGHVVVLKGQAERVRLRDAMTGVVERAHFDVTFEATSGQLPVFGAESEEELEALLDRPAVSRVTIGRIPLPRIRAHVYWPPSQRVSQELMRRNVDRMRNRLPPLMPDDVTFAELEGTDLSTLWDPIVSGHPATLDRDWPWGTHRDHWVRRGHPRTKARTGRT